MAEFKLKFKHDSWNFTAGLQAQAVDFLGSETLLSSPLSSPTMPSSSVPTLSQQNHFIWLGTGGRGSLFSQTLCVYPIIPQKKFTSTRKKTGRFSYLPNLLTSPLLVSTGGLADTWECLNKGFCLCVLL